MSSKMPLPSLGSQLSPGALGLALLVGAIAYVICGAVYSLCFHPLAGIPGPRIAAVSRIPLWNQTLRGRHIYWIRRQHALYGPVVRIGPEDVSYADDGQAWKDIHGYEKGRTENPKAWVFQMQPENGANDILTLDRANHARVRRVFQPAFSDRALKAQESLFLKHADLMVSTVRDASDNGKTVDMVNMYAFTTFDIMGDLTFGQPLGLLENADFIPWVQSAFEAIRVLPFIHLIKFYPLLNAAFNMFEPKWIKEQKRAHWGFTASRVTRRIEQGSDKPDIWKLVMEFNEKDGQGLSLAEMHSNADVFMVAGSETTATLLAGMTYYLLAAPDKLRILVDEIRSSFSCDGDITMERLARLTYLNACIQEGLRIHPPLAIGSPREIPEGGNTILGRWMPPGTRVSVHHFSISRSPDNFRRPDDFVPERWLGDAAYCNDKRDATQPFAYGPRNCLGQNMAMHEMRLLAAKLLFHFDLTLDDPGVIGRWPDQKVYQVWEKRPLVCSVKAVA